MRFLTSSKFALAVALIIGIVTVWSAAMPTVTNTSSLTGGWWLVCDGTPCSYTGSDDCQNYEPDPPYGLEHCKANATTDICVLGSGGHCQQSGPDRCDLEGQGDSCPGGNTICG